MINEAIADYRRRYQELLPRLNADIEKYRKGHFKVKVVKKDGTIYHSGYNFRVKKSGVRPVICLRKEFVVALKQKKF